MLNVSFHKITGYCIILLNGFMILGANTEFTCTSNGRFVDPESADCSSYYLCIGTSDSFYQILFTCPDGSLFNSESAQCTKQEYVCDTTTSSTSTSTTSSSTSTTTSTFTSTTTSTTSTSTTTAAPPNPCENGYICVTDSYWVACVDSVPSGEVTACQGGTSCSNECPVQCTAGTSLC